MGCRAWVVACTTSAVAAGLIAGTAPAQAGVRTQPIGQHCWGPSPHILDIPFYGGASVRTDARRPGVFAVWGHSASLSSYPVDTWVTVTHLPTGHTETFHRRWSARLADRPGYRIDNLHASGPLTIRIRSVTHGPVPLPALTCTGSAVA